MYQQHFGLKHAPLGKQTPELWDEFFGELEHNCIQADALYRQIMGAKWGRRHGNGAIEMLRSDDSAGEQNEQSIGALNPHQLLDIADFICCVEMDVDEFFLCPEEFIPKAA